MKISGAEAKFEGHTNIIRRLQGSEGLPLAPDAHSNILPLFTSTPRSAAEEKDSLGDKKVLGVIAKINRRNDRWVGGSGPRRRRSWGKRDLISRTVRCRAGSKQQQGSLRVARGGADGHARGLPGHHGSSGRRDVFQQNGHLTPGAETSGRRTIPKGCGQTSSSDLDLGAS